MNFADGLAVGMIFSVAIFFLIIISTGSTPIKPVGDFICASHGLGKFIKINYNSSGVESVECEKQSNKETIEVVKHGT